MNLNDKKSNIRRIDFVVGRIVIFVMILIAVYVVVDNYRKDTLLRNSYRTTAIIKEIRHGAVRSSKRVEFTYSVNGRTYENNEPGNYDDFAIGDTILIEYAIEDHSVARVVDKYYMKKNKHLRKEEIVR